MKVAIVCFTAHGADTAVRIREALEDRRKSENEDAGSLEESGELSIRVWCAKSDFALWPGACEKPDHGSSRGQGPGPGVEPLSLPLRRWTKEAFAKYDALVFVGATGIAVRSIAPFLESKLSDPAVLCVDELGKFVIPLVSGHIGGANALAVKLAGKLDSIPVVTTATDLNGKFAVDVFAKTRGMWISDMKLAKQISADVLDGKRIGLVSDFLVAGEIPEELEIRDARKTPAKGRGICITLDEAKRPFEQTLILVPRIVSVGAGCRKGAASAVIEEKICAVLRSCKVSTHSVERLASIDLKAKEPGLTAFAQKYGVEFVTYPVQELKETPGGFSKSAFVESVTGVSNVCERSAVRASGGDHLPPRFGKLIQKKTAGDGVTVALAVRDWSVEFG